MAPPVEVAGVEGDAEAVGGDPVERRIEERRVVAAPAMVLDADVLVKDVEYCQGLL